MKPKSDAERKADQRNRYRQEGLVAVTVWINPKYRERLLRYVRRLKKET